MSILMVKVKTPPMVRIKLSNFMKFIPEVNINHKIIIVIMVINQNIIIIKDIINYIKIVKIYYLHQIIKYYFIIINQHQHKM